MTNLMLALFRNSPTSQLDNNHSPSPRITQLTSESSSCLSDNEISSLYGKYRHSSGCSLNEENLQDASLDQDHPSSHNSFTQGDDANGLPTSSAPAHKSAVIDELNWMLGEAIDSAQTTFGNTHHSSSESSHQPQSSSNPSSHPSPINRFSGLSLESEHTPLKVMQLVQHSSEDLSEPITSSSLSDYSIDPTEDDSKSQQYVRVSSNNKIHPTRAMAIKDSLMKNHSDDSKDSLYSSPSLSKKYSASAISALAHSASSEEILSVAAIEEPDVQLIRRTPSQKNQALPLILSAKKQLQDIVATTHKRIALRDQPRKSSSSDAIPVTPSQDLPSSKSLLRNDSQKSINIHPRKLFEEDDKLVKSTATPNGNGKPLVARSPVVKRSSSDMNILEQWQWLEAQHPSCSSSPQKKHPSSPTDTKQPSHNPPPSFKNTREKYIQALDHHFKSSSSASCGSIESKMAVLSQRQRSLQQSLQRPNANKSGRAIKPVVACFDCVPTVNIKELKKLKTPMDRCRVYEKKLQQLYSQPLGLDLWVWLKTCGESPPVHEAAHQTSDSRPSYSQIRKPGYSPLLNHHQPPLSSLPAHFQRQQSSPGSPALAQIRDTSMSSVASFPLRTGSHTQKAIQIRSSSETQLMEMILPESGMGGRGGHGGMIVNSLMEVNNLPYPSLYPHSAVGANLGVVHQAGPSAVQRRGSHDQGGESGGNPSKATGGGGFFSQITRHNSSKRRQHSASATSSPTKGGSGSSSSNSLVSLPARLAGAPMAAPRGPRPEGPPLFRSSGPDLKALFAKPLEPWLSPNDPERLPSPAARSPHRMTFAYGSSSPSSGVQRLPSTTTHNARVAGFQQHHSAAPPSHPQPSADRRPSHYLSSSKHHFSSPVPSDTDPSSNLPLLIHQKLDKLADILPHADRAILRQILLDNQLDDVVSIGCYLERERALNIS